MTLDEVYRKYKSYVKKSAFLHFGNEERAEDASQDYFLWLSRNFGKFNPTLSDFKKWFIGNMKYSFQNTRKQSYTNRNIKPLDNLFHIDKTVEELAIFVQNTNEDLRETLNTVATKLDSRDLILLQRCVIEGESFTSVSKDLDLSKERVRQLHDKMVKKLKRALESKR